LHDVVLYISGENPNPPLSLPFNKNQNEQQISEILCDIIFDHLIYRSHRPFIVNYLLWMLEYCLTNRNELSQQKQTQLENNNNNELVSEPITIPSVHPAAPAATTPTREELANVLIASIAASTFQSDMLLSTSFPPPLPVPRQSGADHCKAD